MKIITEIIKSRAWINKKTGETTSIYGAVPYVSESDKQNWEIETRGYTWRKYDGTIGLGRAPAKSYEEALEVMNKVNTIKLEDR